LNAAAEPLADGGMVAGIRVGIGVRSTSGAPRLQVNVKPQAEMYTKLNHNPSTIKKPIMVL
jgi:hypothetical protein